MCRAKSIHKVKSDMDVCAREMHHALPAVAERKRVNAVGMAFKHSHAVSSLHVPQPANRAMGELLCYIEMNEPIEIHTITQTPETAMQVTRHSRFGNQESQRE